VAGWLARIRPDDVVVGSKWGYTYVGGWDPAAAGTGSDAVAIAAALARPWASVVLSGAATVDQLESNLRADGLSVPPLPDLAEPPADYWGRRSRRPWL
jgi:aryl-alcohol dehydrogenase-like predicted oxidoreductase